MISIWSNDKNIKFLDLLIYNIISGLIIDASCKDTYNSGGHLMSPNYPHQYENLLDCRWTIKAPVENIITLTLSEFETQSEDKLYIYQGTNIHGLLLTTLFGDDSMPFTSTGNTIYLKFSTNSHTTNTGFKILAEAVGKWT